MSTGIIVGSVLALWVVYELYVGSAYLHRKFERNIEPTGYWLTMLVWSMVAASCFIWW